MGDPCEGRLEDEWIDRVHRFVTVAIAIPLVDVTTVSTDIVITLFIDAIPILAIPIVDFHTQGTAVGLVLANPVSDSVAKGVLAASRDNRGEVNLG